MKMLFNKTNKGGEELVHALGMISSSVDFSKWEPVLPLAARQLKAIIGTDVLNSIAELYWKEGQLIEDDQVLIDMAQKAIAFFAWTKVIPTLDAQHGGSGRQKKIGENEKGLTALQEYKDEANILNLAYEATDALIEFLDIKKVPFWLESTTKKQIDSLLIRSKEEFDTFYHIGSHRLFLVLVPIIREVQRSDILPIIGLERYNCLTKRIEDGSCLELLEECQRPLALLAIKKAVERLPVEVIPEGVVQVQQVGGIKEKLRAEKEARKSVADALYADASRYLQELQDIIAKLDSEPDEVDYYIPGATLQSKGITF